MVPSPACQAMRPSPDSSTAGTGRTAFGGPVPSGTPGGEVVVLEDRAEGDRRRRARRVAGALAAQDHARRPDAVGQREGEAVDGLGSLEGRAEQAARDGARVHAAGAVLERLAEDDPGEARVVLDGDVDQVGRAAGVTLEGQRRQVLRRLRQAVLEDAAGVHAIHLAPDDEADAVGGDGDSRAAGAGARLVPGVDVDDAGHDVEGGRVALLARDVHVVAPAARGPERQVGDAVDRQVDVGVARRRGDRLRAP